METLYFWRCENCSATYFPAGERISDRGLSTRDVVVCAGCLRIAGSYLPVERWTLVPATVRWNPVGGRYEEDYPFELVTPWEPVL